MLDLKSSIARSPHHEQLQQSLDRRIRGHRFTRFILVVVVFLVSACNLTALTVNVDILSDVVKPLVGNCQLPQQYSSPKHGVVVSQNRLCSQAGAEMLHQGGNAADAVSCMTLLLSKQVLIHCEDD